MPKWLGAEVSWYRSVLGPKCPVTVVLKGLVTKITPFDEKPVDDSFRIPNMERIALRNPPPRRICASKGKGERES